jgi:mannose-6-phosphate isomerase-like protein (cupin superfamily)
LEKHLEKVVHSNNLLAIILRADYEREGIFFFTPDDFSQQLAYMNRPEGYRINPHVHNPVSREVHFTQEVLFIRRGKVKIDFYAHSREYLESKVLSTGDVVLLAAGGHGLTMLEPTEMIEVKQGPYVGEQDKTRFDPLG